MKHHFVLLACIASVLCGCGANGSQNQDAPSDSASTLIDQLKRIVIAPQSIPVTHKATASVGAKSGCIAEIGLPFGGRIVRSFVRLGDPVRRGQVLFEVTSSDYMEAVKTYFESCSAADLATANKQRKEVLHQSGMLSDREWEEICAEASNAVNARELSRRSLALFNVDLTTLQVGEPLRVVSPISGRVVRNDLVIGGYLAAEDKAPVTVADLSEVWITAHLKPSQISGIKPGNSVTVVIDSQQRTTGTVFYVGEMLDERTRTLPVVVECSNAGRLLKPGMFVTALFEQGDTSTLVIPSSAVFQGEGAQYVYVQEGAAHYRKAPVVTESLDEGRMRVLSGLSVGDTIIADGGIYLSK